MDVPRAASAVLHTLRGHLLPTANNSLSPASYYTIYMILISLVLCYLFDIASCRIPRVKVPVVGYRCIFEPTWFVRLRFVWAGGSIVREGYKQVS